MRAIWNVLKKNFAEGATRLASLALSSASGYAVYKIYRMAVGRPPDQLVDRHIRVVLGLPLAVTVAAALVAAVRAVEGCLVIEIPGIRVRGAGATLIGWLMCVTALVVALRLLW